MVHNSKPVHYRQHIPPFKPQAAAHLCVCLHFLLSPLWFPPSVSYCCLKTGTSWVIEQKTERFKAALINIFILTMNQRTNQTQYHHYTLQFPSGLQSFTVTLSSLLGFCLTALISGVSICSWLLLLATKKKKNPHTSLPCPALEERLIRLVTSCWK